MRPLGILAVITITVFGTVMSQDCSKFSIGTCQSIFDKSIARKLQKHRIDADIPNWNESFSELRDRCRAYKLYASCIKTVIPHCNQSYKDYFLGLDRAYTFLCESDESIKELADYQRCFSNYKVLSGQKFCNTTYILKLKSLNPKEHISGRVSKFCKYTDNYLECLTSSVEPVCGNNAAKWQKKWNRELRVNMMVHTFNCPGWELSSGGNATMWTIILSVILGLTTLIMIIGIIAILVFVNRKKKSRRRSAVPPPPPPYSCDMMYGGAPPPVGEEGSEPAVSIAQGTPNASSGQAVAVNMRSSRIPVKPPPYADQQAPAYETPTGAAQGAGAVNAGFNEGDVEGKDMEEETGGEGVPQEASGGRSTMTESEKELNSNWF